MLRYLGHFVFTFTLWIVCCYKTTEVTWQELILSFPLPLQNPCRSKLFFYLSVLWQSWVILLENTVFNITQCYELCLVLAKKKTNTLKTFLTSSLTHFEVTLAESSLNSFQMKCHDPSSVVTFHGVHRLGTGWTVCLSPARRLESLQIKWERGWLKEKNNYPGVAAWHDGHFHQR